MVSRSVLAAIIWSVSVGIAISQESKPALPTEHAPQIILASVIKKDGVGFEVLLVNNQRQGFTEKIGEDLTTYEAVVSYTAKFGFEDLSFTSKNGKKLDKEAVLKLLDKPIKVVFFNRTVEPYYLDVFRDDVVILSSNYINPKWKETSRKRIGVPRK